MSLLPKKCLFQFVVKQQSVAWIPHGWCKPSPVDGRLGCFRSLAITSEAAVDMHAKTFVRTCTLILLSKYLGMEWPDHKEGICLLF